MAAPTQLAYRTAKGIGILDAAPVYEALPGFTPPEGNLRCCTYSPDGRFFAWASIEQVFVIDASTGEVLTTLPTPNVYELGFSPLGTYTITWQRPSKDENGDAVKNLKVWTTLDQSGGEVTAVGQFVQKSQTGWNLQYTADEKLCARMVTNEIHFYESGNLGAVWNKLRVEGVTDFSLSPGKNQAVAVFIPERKGQPAAVKVFLVPQFASAVSQKTFFKGDKVQLKWNNLGTSLIVLAQTEVDKSNKSYYGETNMYLLSVNGSFDARVHLDKEGPIHDVTWSPNSKEFGVVYGYMPAKTTIFNARAVVQHQFNLGPRNTILFSPHGRFVIVAGFGNLAGQMDIYDLERDYAKVCTIEASNSSVCEWSPDGKHILTATTSPRLRVDNGLKLYHVSGPLVYKSDMMELYHICWRPQSTAMHPLGNPLQNAPAPHQSAIDYLSTVKTPSKPAGAYRPPGARGTNTPLHFKREDEGGNAYVNNGISSTSGGTNGFGKPRRREVPGAEGWEPPLPPGAAPGGGVSLVGHEDEALSKTALKNKKKREAKKAREAAEKTAGAEGAAASPEPSGQLRAPHFDRRGANERSRSKGGHPDGRSPSRHRNQPQNHHQRHRSNLGPGGEGQGRREPPPQLQNMPPQGLSGDSPLDVTSPGDGSSTDKKVRSLLKKIRAIEDLKMRQAKGEKLEDTQVKKIGTEESIRKELAAVGFNH